MKYCQVLGNSSRNKWQELFTRWPPARAAGGALDIVGQRAYRHSITFMGAVSLCEGITRASSVD